MPAISTIKMRRGTAAQWALANPVLAAGEPGFETDTKVLKFGDGVTAWLSLSVALSGTYAGDAELAALLDPLIVGVITRDANGAATSAGVVWPDGTAGVYTATTVSTAFPGAVDAYTVTKPPLTYTQSAVTRDANGAVTNRPAITVA